jgi:chorismate mutase / prephenate dehydratase
MSRKSPGASDLPTLRQRIDSIDDQLIDLLNQRAEVAVGIGKLKAAAAQPAYAPERERQILDSLRQRSKGPLPESALRVIYKEIISASLALESPMQIRRPSLIRRPSSILACRRA